MRLRSPGPGQLPRSRLIRDISALLLKADMQGRFLFRDSLLMLLRPGHAVLIARLRAASPLLLPDIWPIYAWDGVAVCRSRARRADVGKQLKSKTPTKRRSRASEAEDGTLTDR